MCRLCTTSVHVGHPVPRYSYYHPGCCGDGRYMYYFLVSTLSTEKRKGSVLCVCGVCVVCGVCGVCVCVCSPDAFIESYV